MPMDDRAAALERLGKIAYEETRKVFLAPLLPACLKLSRLATNLDQDSSPAVRNCSKQLFLGEMFPGCPVLLSVLCYWGLSLADNRFTDARKAEGLTVLAHEFRKVFTEADDDDEDTLALQFNSTDHKGGSILP